MKAGDYATALKEFRPLAEQGLAEAQYNLAAMYVVGEG
jgi:TPR repeat protein